MKRLEKIIQNYQEQLKEKGIKNIPEFIQSILNSDITKGKYSRFLLDCYLNNKFREEDLQGGLESTIGQAITLFHKHKSKLSEDMRSVYKYESPGDLWSAVKRFDGELSGKEIKKDEKEKIYAETEFVYTDDETGFKIVSPLTMTSAKWWGKGTRWCTSAEKNNMFWNYADTSPLLILLMPDGKKFQLWKHENDIQFMDKADNQITLDYIEENWDILESVCLWTKNAEYINKDNVNKEILIETLKFNIYSFDILFKKFKNLFDKEVFKIAIENDSYLFYKIPSKYLDIDMFKIILNSEGYMCKDILQKFQSQDFCNYVVSLLPYSLEYISDKYKTKEMCEKAILKNIQCLHYTPEKYKTKELYENIMFSLGSAGKLLPEEYKTEENCKKILESNLDFFPHIPLKYLTKELCVDFIKKNGFISDVPMNFTNDDLIILSLNSGNKIDTIPQHLWNEKILEESVKISFHNLGHIPEESRTEKMCHIAFEQSFEAIKHIPKKFINNHMLEQSLKHNTTYIRYFPKEYVTEKMFRDAIKDNEKNIIYAHVLECKKWLTYSDCEIIVDKFPTHTFLIDEEFLDLDMCKKIINNEKNIENIFELIPPQHLEEIIEYENKEKIIPLNTYRQQWNEIIENIDFQKNKKLSENLKI